MSWERIQCNLGHSHEVWCQDRDNACGPSCMIMAYERIWKKKPDDESLFYEAYNLYGNDSKGATARVTNGFEYTYTTNLATTMSKFIGKAKTEDVGEFNVATKLYASLLGHKTIKPVIGLVTWVSGGGHFVLIDKVTVSNKIVRFCVCDPWDGNVHNVAVNIARLNKKVSYMPDYNPNQHTTLAGGGGIGPSMVPTTFQDDGGLNSGFFNGWLIWFI